jgi:peptide deformylase
MIITDESLLRVDCQIVLPDEINDLRHKLEEALLWSERRGLPGVGLAAPQIGIPKKMAIIRIDNNISFDLINAEIKEKYNPFIFDGEGCLSFPNKYAKTSRYKEIVVVNNLVDPKCFIATEFSSVVISHELDHLEKRLLTDYAL